MPGSSARPKKKKDEPPTPEGQNRPFRDLDRLAREAGLKLGGDNEPLEPVPSEQSSEVPSDEEAFAAAMEGVTRLPWRDLTSTSQQPVDPPPDARRSEEWQLMQDALNGIPTPSVLDHPEYIEGWIGVAGRRYLPKLRDGLFSIQAQLDLHGLGREEARRTVEEFVARMAALRPCCVKIIHGRGINSPNEQGVLKQLLQLWLSTRRMSRHVVAYASAPFKDGGVGAIYVLLRGPGRSRR